jgi:hypothetical protein
MKLINEVWNWVKKHRIASIIIIAVLITFLPPLIIHVLYWLGLNHPIISTHYSAVDLLSYWGSFFSAIGTIALGLLALWQNHTLSKQTDAAQKRLEELELNKIKPKMNLKFRLLSDTITYLLYNRGNGTAFSIIINDYYNDEYVDYVHLRIDNKEISELKQNNEVELEFNYKNGKTEYNWHLGVEITYFDLNDEQYKWTLELLLTNNSHGAPAVKKRIENEVRI